MGLVQISTFPFHYHPCIRLFIRITFSSCFHFNSSYSCHLLNGENIVELSIHNVKQTGNELRVCNNNIDH